MATKKKKFTKGGYYDRKIADQLLDVAQYRKIDNFNKSLAAADVAAKAAAEMGSFKGIAASTFKGLPSASLKLLKSMYQNPKDSALSIGSGIYKGGLKPLAEIQYYTNPANLIPSVRKKNREAIDRMSNYEPKTEEGKALKSGFEFSSAVVPYSVAGETTTALSKMPRVAAYVAKLGKYGPAAVEASGWLLGGQMTTDKKGLKGRAEQAASDLALFGMTKGLGKGLNLVKGKAVEAAKNAKGALDKSISKSAIRIAEKKSGGKIPKVELEGFEVPKVQVNAKKPVANMAETLRQDIFDSTVGMKKQYSEYPGLKLDGSQQLPDKMVDHILDDIGRKVEMRTGESGVIDGLKKELGQGKYLTLEDLQKAVTKKFSAPVTKTATENISKEVGSKVDEYNPAVFRTQVDHPTGEIDTIVTSPRELTKKLSKDLKVTDRVIRERTKGNTLGTFTRQEDMVRLKGADDFTTYTHEVGHQLHDKLDIATKGFGDELKALDYAVTSGSKDAAKGRVREGVAEFTRLFVTDPEQAKQLAPKFYAHFESTVPEEVKSALLTAREGYQQFGSMTRGAQIESMISMKPTTKVQKEMEQLSNLGVKDYVKDKLNNFYTGMVDKLHPVKSILGEEPYQQMRIAAGKQATIQYTFDHNTIDFNTLKANGEGFMPIMKDLDAIGKNYNMDSVDTWRKFGRYLIDRRNAYDIDRPLASGFTKQGFIDDVKVLEKQYPEFKKLAQRTYDFQSRVLKYAYDSGVVSTDLYKKLIQNKNYVPFFKDIEGKAATAGTNIARGIAQNPIKRLGERETADMIINPIENISKNTFLLMNAANNNQAMQSVARAVAENQKALSPFIRLSRPKVQPINVKGEELTKFFESLGVPVEDMGDDLTGELFTIFRRSAFQPKNTVTLFDKGKMVQMTIADPMLFDAVNGLNKKASGALVKLMSLPASALRAGATLNPSFMVRNMMRDSLSASIYSRHKTLFPAADFLKGVKTMFGSSAADKEIKGFYEASGAPLSTLVSLDRQELQKQMLSELTSNEGKFANSLNFFKRPLDPLRKVSSGIEEATRLGEFAKAFNQYNKEVVSGKMTLKQAIEKAGFDSREITLDFGRQGKWVEGLALNRMAAFFNAGIQGADKLVRELGRPATWAKAFGFITIPSIALWSVNKENPDYQALPTWKKDLFWHIPTGDKGMPFIEIPKPFELGVLFGSLPERFLDYTVMKDPKALKEVKESIMSMALPNAPIPTALAPMVEFWGNRSLFFGNQIVSSADQGLPKEFQFRSTSPEYLKDLAKSMPDTFSPAQAEQMIYDWTGGLGRIASKGIDKVYRAATGGPEAPASYSPGVSMGMKLLNTLGLATERPIGSSDVNTERFYDDLENARKANLGTKESIKQGDLEHATNYAKDSSGYGQLNKIAIQLSKLRQAKESIRNDKNMSADEKRKKMDQIDEVISSLVRSTQ